MKLDAWAGPSVPVMSATAYGAQRKQWRDWQEAGRNPLPVQSIRNSARQVAMNKAGLLKQRLEALKALLRFATPDMARRFARELKDIARELAAIAKSLGSGAGATTATTATVAAPEDGTGAVGTQGGEAGVAATAASASSGSPGDAAGNDARDAQGDDDAGLKSLLRDARKLLKEVIDQIKARLAHAKPEARRDLQAAEKGLADLDEALNQADASATYTRLGDISEAAAASAASGLRVDLRV